MAENFQKPQSAPQCQLNKLGTEDTFKTLVSALKTLSKNDIEDLEDDLSFYTETGLIGVQMSRLLDELRDTETATAAA